MKWTHSRARNKKEQIVFKSYSFFTNQIDKWSLETSKHKREQEKNVWSNSDISLAKKRTRFVFDVCSCHANRNCTVECMAIFPVLFTTFYLQTTSEPNNHFKRFNIVFEMQLCVRWKLFQHERARKKLAQNTDEVRKKRCKWLTKK